MGAIHVHEFMSLDGVIDTPMWTAEYSFTPGMGKVIGGVMERCRGILLDARRTRCSRRRGRSGPRRTIPARRSSTTRRSTSSPRRSRRATATWRNSKAIGPYDPDAIRKSRTRSRDLYVSGSGTLVRAMLADGLVDELHLFVYPLRAAPSPAVPRGGFAPQAVARGV